MKRYQLPERLGGGIVECEEYQKDGNDWVWFSVGDWMYHCRADALTEVKPPLPPEPDAPAVMLGGRVWVRQGFVGDYHYEASGFHGHSWLALNQLSNGVPIVPLVPDPVVSAPELPFKADAAIVEVNPNPDDDEPIWLHVESTWRTPDEAERIGLAILRAAREARTAS